MERIPALSLAHTLEFEQSAPSNAALLADYFGLSPDYNGAICFNPRIDNFVADFNFFVGLDNWLCGLYFEMHLPIVHTRWTLFDHCSTSSKANCCAVPGAPVVPDPCSADNLCVPVQSNGATTAFLPGYMNSAAKTSAGIQTIQNQTTGLNAVTPTSDLLTALSGTFHFGDMQTDWSGGIVSQERFNETRLADLEIQLGYDFWKDQCSHFGAFLELVCPTGGHQRHSSNVFGPFVGNGGYFELGAGVSGHYDAFVYGEHNFSLWVYGNVTHGFSKWQTRTFDFNDGPFSRYMLLKELNEDGTYSGNMINAVNYTTRQVKANVRVKGDASFKLAYDYCGFTFDIGYNIYGDSGERCSKKSKCASSTATSSTATALATAAATASGCAVQSCTLDSSRIFGKKGCANDGAIYYNAVAGTTAGTTVVGTLVSTALSNTLETQVNATASKSTAFSCSIASGTGGTSVNAAIDNAQDITGNGSVDGACVQTAIALTSVPTNIAGQEICPAAGTGVHFAVRSTTPVPVSLADLNICSGLARSQITHKLFGYAGYNWMECDYAPFVGFLWEVEFAQGSGKQKKCSSSTTTTSTPSSCCNIGGCDFNGPDVDFTVASNSSGCGDSGNKKHRGGVSLWGIGLKAGIAY
jgi:hypothetical protein